MADKIADIRSGLERLSPESLESLLALLVALLDKKKWKPGCGKERTYTYEHIVQVEDCPISEAAQQKIENDAQKKAEDQAKAYCARNDDNCTECDILDSSPTGGGCNCVTVGGITKCAYVCRWTVKYICKKAAD
ncbi:MAG: hypothetical protein ACYDAB_02380 [bacterium]